VTFFYVDQEGGGSTVKMSTPRICAPDCRWCTVYRTVYDCPNLLTKARSELAYFTASIATVFERLLPACLSPFSGFVFVITQTSKEFRWILYPG